MATLTVHRTKGLSDYRANGLRLGYG